MLDPQQDRIDALKTAPKIKIQAEWTTDSYCHQSSNGDISEIGVDGWLVRINGIKFPRPREDHSFDGGRPIFEDGWDWTWRYTPQEGNTEAGKQKAIDQAMREARLPWSQLQSA